MDQVEPLLEEGLKLAKAETAPEVTAYALDCMAGLRVKQKKYSEAIADYQEGIGLVEAINPLLTAKLTTHAASAFVTQGNAREASAWLGIALKRLENLRDSHEKAYNLILVGQGYRRLGTKSFETSEQVSPLAQLALSEAATVAEKIVDNRSLAYAFGYLGQLHEDGKNYQEALQLTHKAIFAAQLSNANESLYKWEWQAGRVLKAQHNPTEAIASYRSAIQTLQTVRQAMAAECKSGGKSALEPVKPIYYEYADLLLDHAASLPDSRDNRPYLVEARNTLESMQATELQDYFQDPCIASSLTRKTSLESVSKDALIVYSVCFSNRLVLLASVGSEIKQHTVPLDSQTLSDVVHSFRLQLEKRTAWGYLPYARKLYDWIVRPLEPDLSSKRIGTIVFVPDGVLRTIPLASLHDGKQFLIEKVAVAINPGLDLTDPHPVERNDVKVLSAGLSESVQGFRALANVRQELEGIQGLYGGSRLENREFTKANLEGRLKSNPYSLVHIATHGEFAHQATDTFLLLWDDKIDMDQLDRIMRRARLHKNPIGLLALSAPGGR